MTQLFVQFINFFSILQNLVVERIVILLTIVQSNLNARQMTNTNESMQCVVKV